MNVLKNYVNGQWIDSVSSKTEPVYNPATGEIIAQVQERQKEKLQRVY